MSRRYNKEKALLHQKRYAERNGEKLSKRRKEYYARNKEELLRKNREYQKCNPDIYSLCRHRYRAKKAGNGGSHTIEQRRKKFLDLGNVCYYCGIPGKMTIDHLTPISRGGTDDIDNIVPACQKCNSSKKDKTAQEFFDSMTSEDIARNLAAISEFKYRT